MVAFLLEPGVHDGQLVSGTEFHALILLTIVYDKQVDTAIKHLLHAATEHIKIVPELHT